MTTIAIVGAGRGLGVAVTRRLGRQGFDVVLQARWQEHTDEPDAQAWTRPRVRPSAVLPERSVTALR